MPGKQPPAYRPRASARSHNFQRVSRFTDAALGMCGRSCASLGLHREPLLDVRSQPAAGDVLLAEGSPLAPAKEG